MIEIGRPYHDVDNINHMVVVTDVSQGYVHSVFAEEHPAGKGIVLLGVQPDPVPVDRFMEQWA